MQQALLEHNAKVYMGSRSKSKADAAIKDLKAATGKEAIFLELDLSSLASVRRAADEFLRCARQGYLVSLFQVAENRFSKETELHLLFLNAYV